LHDFRPEPHATSQVLFAQAGPPTPAIPVGCLAVVEQTLPQLPQLLTLVEVLTQAFPQSCDGSRQEPPQVPLTQVGDPPAMGGQTFPQEPQFCVSVWRLAHWAPQSVVPLEQSFLH
jgi:hypothetical protein